MVRVPTLRRGRSAASGGASTRLTLASVRRRTLSALALAIALALAAAACARNVKQDAATGEDGKSDGAVELTMANNEVIAKGIVTYPGGDRVDWRVFELPKDQLGTMTVDVAWTPPRPGLDLQVAVLNQWNHVVAETKALPKRSNKRKKQLVIENAKGKYFLQIYAPNRGDAARYTVTVTFAAATLDSFDWLKESIADPPKLPAVPPPPVDCTPTSFDKKNPACASVCPMPADPAWPACAGVCPTPPDPAIPSCLEVMPCPNPPDRKFKKCTAADFPPCKAAMPPEEKKKNPNCDRFCPPDVVAEVSNVVPEGSTTTVTVSAGKTDGVDKGWTGELLDPNDVPIKNSKFTVTIVTNQAAVGKVKVSASALPQGVRARLRAPCPNR